MLETCVELRLPPLRRLQRLRRLPWTIEQELASVTVYRRSETGFQREVYSGLDATIPLPEIGAALALADLYDGVEWIPEPDEDL